MDLSSFIDLDSNSFTNLMTLLNKFSISSNLESEDVGNQIEQLILNSENILVIDNTFYKIAGMFCDILVPAKLDIIKRVFIIRFL